MTKAQSIHTAQQTLGTIICDIVNNEGVITPDQHEAMTADAHRCFIILGHVQPLDKAQSFIADCTAHCQDHYKSDKKQSMYV